MPIPPENKYGLIALPQVKVKADLPASNQMREDLWFTTDLPFDIPEHWQDWVGSIKARAVAGSNLFILSSAPSKSPDILDAENQALGRRAYEAYWGLLLTDFVRIYNGQPIRLTGAHRPDGIDVRSIGDLDQPGFTKGSAWPEIDLDRLDLASALADGLRDLPGQGKLDRFGRVLRAFQMGIHETQDVSEKTHQFVRCVEGLILPEQGKTEKQFKSRTELFVGPQHHDLMGQLFEIRSATVHLHAAHEAFSTPPDLRDRLIVLTKRAVEAEAIARHCIGRVLLTPAMWPWLETDLQLRAFWALDSEERSAIWGDPLDLESVSQSFDPRFINDEDLGIA